MACQGKECQPYPMEYLSAPQCCAWHSSQSLSAHASNIDHYAHTAVPMLYTPTQIVAMRPIVAHKLASEAFMTQLHSNPDFLVDSCNFARMDPYVSSSYGNSINAVLVRGSVHGLNGAKRMLVIGGHKAGAILLFIPAHDIAKYQQAIAQEVDSDDDDAGIEGLQEQLMAVDSDSASECTFVYHFKDTATSFTAGELVFSRSLLQAG